MFKNYLAIALRNFSRNRIFSVINILGLSIGISTALVIFLIVQYSNSYDRFEKNSDHLFRVVSDYVFQGEPGHTRGVPAPLAEALNGDLNGIDNLVSFRYYSPQKLSVQQAAAARPVVFKQQNQIIFADAHYFDLLPYRWIVGNKKSASNLEGQVVLTESRARLYFPKTSFADMMGRKIIYDDSLSATVSGIVEDLDKQGKTDFSFREFVSLQTILKNKNLQNSMYWNDWGSTTSDQQLWLQLGGATSAASMEKRLKLIFDKHQGEDARKNNYTWTYKLQPLQDIHFNGNYGSFDSPTASRSTLTALMLVAAFLILIASINFINLTTANAAKRAKEIGVRKTMGSTKGQLIFQFLGETFLITLIATLFSILLSPFILKLFSSFIPEGVHFSLADPFVIPFLVILLISVTGLAGFYPAWVLSSAKTPDVLKNRAHAGTNTTRQVWLRKGLTVSQFMIAQFFIIGALMVSKQIRFMMNSDLGFSKQSVVSISFPYSDTSLSHKKYVVGQWQKIPGVQLTTIANHIPSSYNWWTTTMEYGAGKKLFQSSVELKSGDKNYLSLLQIHLLAGRDLPSTDTANEILINETYLHVLGFKQPAEALGKMLKWDDKMVSVAGVFHDFHAHPLNFKIGPMAIVRAPDRSDMMMALLTTDHAAWPAILENMKKTFLAAYPGEEFKYDFLDESISNAYDQVQRTSKLLAWATGLTIFICCLGLLGLVIYTTTHRAKEISIRKVLGASVTQIMTLLSGDFIKLVALAFVIATPVAWWATHAWLEDFVFRTPASWWIFLVSGIGMMLIALVTLSIQTVRSAMANPAISLRSE